MEGLDSVEYKARECFGRVYFHTPDAASDLSALDTEQKEQLERAGTVI